MFDQRVFDPFHAFIRSALTDAIASLISVALFANNINILRIDKKLINIEGIIYEQLKFPPS